jgi:hypothetical protein
MTEVERAIMTYQPFAKQSGTEHRQAEFLGTLTLVLDGGQS